MILYPYPISTLVYYVQQAESEITSASLAIKDARLQTEIPATELASGNFKNIAKWIYSSTRLVVGTNLSMDASDDEMYRTHDCFLFGKVKAGDLMEAYSLLYRMRWVRYQKGRPAYELVPGKDQVDSAYDPQDASQQRRFDATKVLLDVVDKMAPRDKANLLAGQPLRYGDMSPEMRDAFANLAQAAYDTSRSSRFQRTTQSDFGPVTAGEFTLRDTSKQGTGVQELWLGTNVKSPNGSFGSSFRWTDYDKTKNHFSSSRPMALVHEPLSDEGFSRKDMIAKSKKLQKLVTIQKEVCSLADLLKYLSEKFDLNFITNQDTSGIRLAFSCENIPLAHALDQISKAYGDWEWEAAPGNFIVMRSNESPRRRTQASQ